jgi:hypothetical protein
MSRPVVALRIVLSACRSRVEGSVTGLRSTLQDAKRPT